MSGGQGKMKDNRRQKGAAAEQAAADLLLSTGYRIRDRNWRCRSGELDVVAEDGGVIVFVEVRSRTAGTSFGTAAESVNFRKIRKVRSTAEVYLHAQRLEGREVRFDVVAVELGRDLSIAAIHHIQGAF
ncbi:YraN family protein [Paenibacillus sp. AR247]|uniref:YraN family protein n=1 Tax=Paenibacillus sp. AR247 TaxID=1631599 RepID=UPI000CF8F359|nr:YraN family protein [Paenibacillus sp. AR247]PQP89622.1 YraN family protein [Paenibacillus sp. AR247]